MTDATPFAGLPVQAGDKVYLIANPGRFGTLRNETDGVGTRLKVLVEFDDGGDGFFLPGSLAKVAERPRGPVNMVRRGSFGLAADLRGAITAFRLSGRLANLIYSLNSTNTQFFAYQFRPVVQFLDSPCNGLLIADEVGLGKTIEAGLIWTELKARVDARRLLVVCPAALREKWQRELDDRFGVKAEIVNAAGLLSRLQAASTNPDDGFALIASMQGLRPPEGWNDTEVNLQSATARLGRFLVDVEVDDALVDLVVIDEAHYLRNRGTQTHRMGMLLRPIAQHMVMLSATPIQLHNKELFNLLHLLDADSFPFESSFQQTLVANRPLVALRDQVRLGVSQAGLLEGLRATLAMRWFEDNQQLQHLIAQPPSEAELATKAGRAELADRLDRINPLTKAFTRTLKRDVHELHVVRRPVAVRAAMHPVEAAFYEQVTDCVRHACEHMNLSQGFMLTIPQRQMASSMAAACRGWALRAGKPSKALGDEMEETLTGVYGAQEKAETAAPALGTLLSALVSIARSVGDYPVLKANDTKYARLLRSLRRYWRMNKRKKVVLFSFYKHTLHYLAERLGEDGIASVLVHGGMDKQEALRNFEDPDGPDILLSSEVSAEGVDLQFSSLVVNYDLPWNPARIEQRIGRIDRIGQQADKVLIWNLMYANTIDDRIYRRLLMRLNIFREALGSMEAVLGDEIRRLGYELLSHDLTPQQQQTRIEEQGQVIENNNFEQRKLEAQATQLIAHGEFINNKVRAARELGRFIDGYDLFAYVADFFDREYPGTRFPASGGPTLECRATLSVEAQVQLREFLSKHRLQGKTAILSASPPRLLFENRLGKIERGVERVTQEHPLVRFVSEQLKLNGRSAVYCQVSAVRLVSPGSIDVVPGVYVYAVARWAVSGVRDVEQLAYLAQPLDGGEPLLGEAAEHLVNSAAIAGKDWPAAVGEIDLERAGEVLDVCRHQLMEQRFEAFTAAQSREDRDRIQLMVKSLLHHLDAQREKIEERIALYERGTSGRQRRMIPAEKGKLSKLTLRIETRLAELRLKADTKADASFVSGGVIRVG
jgi:superfamily II DNA or RNA helicase